MGKRQGGRGGGGGGDSVKVEDGAGMPKKQIDLAMRELSCLRKAAKELALAKYLTSQAELKDFIAPSLTKQLMASHAFFEDKKSVLELAIEAKEASWGDDKMLRSEISQAIKEGKQVGKKANDLLKELAGEQRTTLQSRVADQKRNGMMKKQKMMKQTMVKKSMGKRKTLTSSNIEQLGGSGSLGFSRSGVEFIVDCCWKSMRVLGCYKSSCSHLCRVVGEAVCPHCSIRL